MKIIALSSKKFKELNKLNLSRDILNTEGIMYDFNYKGKQKLLKELFVLNGPTFANKLYTLEMLDSNKEYLPSSFCIPDNLCTVGGNVVGFTIPKLQGINLTTILKSKDINYQEQIYYLKKIGEILNQLYYIRQNTPLKDIYINDLHDSNFIVDNNKKELKVIDLDSCKIGSNKPFAARFLTPASLINNINKYKINKDENSNRFMIADSNTDLYCYSKVILNYLYGESFRNNNIDDFYEYLNYLEAIGINKDLVNIFSKLVSNCENENPLNYLDSLTSEQIYRAKKNVYSITKNNII